MPRRKTEDDPAAPIRVLKTASCKSVAGKAKLKYQIGCTPNSEIYLRIAENAGGGFFSKEWVALSDIQEALDKSPEDEPITATVLCHLFRGRSVNTPAFLLAALSHERLLRPLKGKKRGHELLDPAGFEAKVEKLISGSNAKKTRRTNKKRAAKKAPRKTQASMPRRKKAAAVRAT